MEGKFKTDRSGFLTTGITDTNLKGLIETLTLGTLMKYSSSLTKAVEELNDSFGMDQDFIEVNHVVDLLVEEVFRAMDYWKATNYTRKKQLEFTDESELLTFYVNGLADKPKIYEWINSFNLLREVFNNFIQEVDRDTRKTHSLIPKFLEVRDYVKKKKIKMGLYITAFGNWATSIQPAHNHSISHNLIPTTPMSAPNTTLPFITMSGSAPASNGNITMSSNSPGFYSGNINLNPKKKGKNKP